MVKKKFLNQNYTPFYMFYDHFKCTHIQNGMFMECLLRCNRGSQIDVLPWKQSILENSENHLKSFPFMSVQSEYLENTHTYFNLNLCEYFLSFSKNIFKSC